MTVLTGLGLGLLDDAATLLPRGVPVADALASYRASRDTPAEGSLGALVVPASAVAGLRAASEPTDDVPVALLGDTGLDELVEARHTLQDDAWFRVVRVHVRLPAEHLARAAEVALDALPFTVPTSFELPFTPELPAALDVLAADGTEQAGFRSDPRLTHSGGSDPLATFLHACVTRGLGFTLTAGAAGALSARDTLTGARQHGVANGLAATAAALAGASVAELDALLGARDPGALMAVLASCDVASVRALHRSVAVCDVPAAHTQLAALGLAPGA